MVKDLCCNKMIFRILGTYKRVTVMTKKILGSVQLQMA